TPGTRPEPYFAIQIDTTLYRSESSVIHGFQRFTLSFNRTVVMRDLFYYPKRGQLADDEVQLAPIGGTA
ncbi:MAG: hypothetical protein ABIN99_02260, partial [Nitrosospira sp.]